MKRRGRPRLDRPKPTRSKYVRDGCGRRWVDVLDGLRHVCRSEGREAPHVCICPCGKADFDLGRVPA
jgi:hypothetical protein